MKTIRQEPEVDSVVDFAAERWTRGRDAWDAVLWGLARDPGAGSALTTSGRSRSFTLSGAISIGLPTVTVVYVIDGETVTVIDANFC
jgi:hypothetical protein